MLVTGLHLGLRLAVVLEFESSLDAAECKLGPLELGFSATLSLQGSMGHLQNSLHSFLDFSSCHVRLLSAMSHHEAFGGKSACPACS